MDVLIADTFGGSLDTVLNHLGDEVMSVFKE